LGYSPCQSNPESTIMAWQKGLQLSTQSEVPHKYVSSFWIVEPSCREGGTHCLHAYTLQREAKFHTGLQLSGVVHLDTVQLLTSTYSDRCGDFLLFKCCEWLVFNWIVFNWTSSATFHKAQFNWNLSVRNVLAYSFNKKMKCFVPFLLILDSENEEI